ncbi:hypothetical protein ABXN37_15145 [Piscinibacter sakaiensis]|uniref:hypothetical protein n=1 Tax=Piscinibacter sakaiensis TaxID=1547922 RepID=UPI00372AE410
MRHAGQQQRRVGDRAARRPVRVGRRRGEHGAAGVDDQQPRAAHRHGVRRERALQAQRRQQHEAQRAVGTAGGIGHLQHGPTGQASEGRLQHDLAARGQCALEVGAVVQVELAAAAQRIAEQPAVGADRQDAGVLRVGLAHLRQEGGAGGPVPGVEVGGARQPEVQLRRALDAVAQRLGVDLRGAGQAPGVGLDRGLAVLDETRQHQQGRQHRGQQRHQQQPRADAHRALPPPVPGGAAAMLPGAEALRGDHKRAPAPDPGDDRWTTPLPPADC